MKEEESNRYGVEITNGKNNSEKIWLDVNILGIDRKKSVEIICEVEKTKECIKEILAR